MNIYICILAYLTLFVAEFATLNLTILSSSIDLTEASVSITFSLPVWGESFNASKLSIHVNTTSVAIHEMRNKIDYNSTLLLVQLMRDDLNSLLLLNPVQNLTFIEVAQGAVLALSLNTNFSQITNTTNEFSVSYVSSVIPDYQTPFVEVMKLNMDSQSLFVKFSEPMDFNSTVISECVVIQNFPNIFLNKTRKDSISVAMISSSDGMRLINSDQQNKLWAEFLLGRENFDNIKSKYPLASDEASTFISVPSECQHLLTDSNTLTPVGRNATAFIKDLSGNPLSPVGMYPFNAHPIRNYTADTLSPWLDSFNVSLDRMSITLYFSEVIDIHSIKISNISISNGITSMHLSSSSQIIPDVISWNKTDMVKLKDRNRYSSIASIILSDADEIRFHALDLCLIDSITSLQLTIHNNSYRDANIFPNYNLGDIISSSNIIMDTSQPRLAYFDLDMTRRILEMQFNEVIDVNSLHVGVITISNRKDITEGSSITLSSETKITNSHLWLQDEGLRNDSAKLIEIHISEEDFDYMKMLGIGISSETAFLSYPSRFAADFGMTETRLSNRIVAIDGREGQSVRSYTADIISPFLLSCAINMSMNHEETISLEFSEPIDASSLITSELWLMSDSMNGYFTKTRQLRNNSLNRFDSSNRNIVIKLSNSDIVSIKSNHRLQPFLKTSASSFLFFSSSFANDIPTFQLIAENDSQALIINSLIAIDRPSPIQCTNQPDVSGPSIIKLSMDLSSRVLILHFDEPVDACSIDASLLTLKTTYYINNSSTTVSQTLSMSSAIHGDLAEDNYITDLRLAIAIEDYSIFEDNSLQSLCNMLINTTIAEYSSDESLYANPCSHDEAVYVNWLHDIYVVGSNETTHSSIVIEANLIDDVYGNPNMYTEVLMSDIISDNINPSISSWSLSTDSDDYGNLTLHFSETVSLESVKPMYLTLFSLRGTRVASEWRLSHASSDSVITIIDTFPSIENACPRAVRSVVIILSGIANKLINGLSWKRSFGMDMTAMPFNDVSLATSLRSGPTLTGFTLSMQDKLLSLTFSENCVLSSLLLSSLVLRSHYHINADTNGYSKDWSCKQLSGRYCTTESSNGTFIFGEHDKLFGIGYATLSDSYTLNFNNANFASIRLSDSDFESIQTSKHLAKGINSSFAFSYQDMVVSELSDESQSSFFAPVTPFVSCSGFIPDMTGPELEYFDLNLDSGLLVLQFSEPVIVPDIDDFFAGIILIHSNVSNATYDNCFNDESLNNNSVSFVRLSSNSRIVNASSYDPNSLNDDAQSQIQVSIEEWHDNIKSYYTDRDRIHMSNMLATSRENLFIEIRKGIVHDTSSFRNPVTETSCTNPLQVRRLIHDRTNPELVKVEIDLNFGGGVSKMPWRTDIEALKEFTPFIHLVFSETVICDLVAASDVVIQNMVERPSMNSPFFGKFLFGSLQERNLSSIQHPSKSCDVEISNADMLWIRENSTQVASRTIFTSLNDSFVSLLPNATQDISFSHLSSEEVFENHALQAAILVQDSIPPSLTSYEMDVNTKTIILHFNEVMDCYYTHVESLVIQDSSFVGLAFDSDIDFEGQYSKITNRNAEYESHRFSSPFTFSNCLHSNLHNDYSIVLNIGEEDMIALKASQKIASRNDSTFLQTISHSDDNFTDYIFPFYDCTGNGMLPIQDGEGQNPTNFATDTISPSLIEASLSAHAILMLRFDEAVLSGSFQPMSVFLSSTLYGDETYFLSQNSRVIDKSADNRILYIIINFDDHVMLREEIGTKQSNSFIGMNSSAVTDRSGNSVLARYNGNLTQIGPVVEYFDVDFVIGMLSLKFSTNVAVSSVNSSKIILSYREGTNDVEIIRLQAISPNGTQLVDNHGFVFQNTTHLEANSAHLLLCRSDLFYIKSTVDSEGFARFGSDESRIKLEFEVALSSAVSDLGNQSVLSQGTNSDMSRQAVKLRKATTEAVPPFLRKALLDLNSNPMITLYFSEPINLEKFEISGIIIATRLSNVQHRLSTSDTYQEESISNDEDFIVRVYFSNENSQIVRESWLLGNEYSGIALDANSFCDTSIAENCNVQVRLEDNMELIVQPDTTGPVFFNEMTQNQGHASINVDSGIISFLVSEPLRFATFSPIFVSVAIINKSHMEQLIIGSFSCNDSNHFQPLNITLNSTNSVSLSDYTLISSAQFETNNSLLVTLDTAILRQDHDRIKRLFIGYGNDSVAILMIKITDKVTDMFNNTAQLPTHHGFSIFDQHASYASALSSWDVTNSSCNFREHAMNKLNLVIDLGNDNARPEMLSFEIQTQLTRTCMKMVFNEIVNTTHLRHSVEESRIFLSQDGVNISIASFIHEYLHEFDSDAIFCTSNNVAITITDPIELKFRADSFVDESNNGNAQGQIDEQGPVLVAVILDLDENGGNSVKTNSSFGHLVLVFSSELNVSQSNASAIRFSASEDSANDFYLIDDAVTLISPMKSARSSDSVLLITLGSTNLNRLKFRSLNGLFGTDKNHFYTSFGQKFAKSIAIIDGSQENYLSTRNTPMKLSRLYRDTQSPKINSSILLDMNSDVMALNLNEPFEMISTTPNKIGICVSFSARAINVSFPNSSAIFETSKHSFSANFKTSHLSIVKDDYDIPYGIKVDLSSHDLNILRTNGIIARGLQQTNFTVEIDNSTSIFISNISLNLMVESNMFMDAFGNVGASYSPADNKRISNIIHDVSKPNLVSFDAEANRGQFKLQFSEPVDAVNFNLTQSNLILQSSYNTLVESEYESMGIVSAIVSTPTRPSNWISHSTDQTFDSILNKLINNICESPTSCYSEIIELKLADNQFTVAKNLMYSLKSSFQTFLCCSLHLTHDAFQNSVIERINGYSLTRGTIKSPPIGVTMFVRDESNPEALQLSLFDINEGIIRVAMSKTIKQSTIFHNAVLITSCKTQKDNHCESYRLKYTSMEDSAVISANEQEESIGASCAVQLQISIKDIEQIKSYKLLATNKETTSVLLSPSFAEDHSGNQLLSPESGKSLEAISYISDNVRPTLTSFKMDMNEELLSLQFSEAITSVSIQSLGECSRLAHYNCLNNSFIDLSRFAISRGKSLLGNPSVYISGQNPMDDRNSELRYDPLKRYRQTHGDVDYEPTLTASSLSFSSQSNNDPTVVDVHLSSKVVNDMKTLGIGVKQKTAYMTVLEFAAADRENHFLNSIYDASVKGHNPLEPISLVTDSTNPRLMDFLIDYSNASFHMLFSEPISRIDLSKLEIIQGNLSISIPEPQSFLMEENRQRVIVHIAKYSQEWIQLKQLMNTQAYYKWEEGVGWDMSLPANPTLSSFMQLGLCSQSSSSILTRFKRQDKVIIGKPDCTSPCETDEYMSQPCTFVRDRVCSPCTYSNNTCPVGMFLTASCGETNGNKQSDISCQMCLQCPTGYYAKHPCTEHKNTVCALCAICKTGHSEYIREQCTIMEDTKCSSCKECEFENYKMKIGCQYAQDAVEWKRSNCKK